MEKISGIVRSNSRTSSVDLKTASAVRPGTPNFGRPVGTSSAADPNALPKESTASKAVALHNEMIENRKSNSQDHIVSNLADQFFMSRVRRPEVQEVVSPSVDVDLEAHSPNGAEADLQGLDPVLTSTNAFTPRGTYIDVEA